MAGRTGLHEHGVDADGIRFLEQPGEQIAKAVVQRVVSTLVVAIDAVRARPCLRVDRSRACLEEELVVQSRDDVGGDGDAALRAQGVPDTTHKGGVQPVRFGRCCS